MEPFRPATGNAFERITADWPESERIQFARLLPRFTEASAAFRKRETSMARGFER
jgi:hypothetical protein